MAVFFFLTGAMRLPGHPSPDSAKVVSSATLWQVELNPSSLRPPQAFKPGTEVFLLDTPLLRAAQYDNTPVIWHWDGAAWSPISGGLAPVPTGRSVARTPEGVALLGLPATVSGPRPLLHDGWGFRASTGATNDTGGVVLVTSPIPQTGETACVPATWSDQPDRTFLAQVRDSQWEPVTGPLPLQKITHVATSGDRLAIGGGGTSAASEIWRWTHSAWEKIGEFTAPDGASTIAPQILSLEWHADHLAAGCQRVRIGGILHSNLVVWNGHEWTSPVPIPAPAQRIKSSGSRLYIGLQSGGIPSVWTWNGVTVESLGAVELATLEDLSVSDHGLLAVVGTPKAPSTIPLWFRRGDHWEAPSGWTSPDPNPLTGCVWMGNDLHLTGIRATLSDVESLGLGIWHEPGIRIVARLDDPQSQSLALRATGAVPARFIWERSHDLSAWVPFATNALGNPGWIQDEGAGGGAVFYRVRVGQ
ncbi:MAG: hypothetical protein KIT22_00280 [Verrucomicrobiae bacterium]|nr:hypothetical protein [Verrucomicrobiae bacterium]